MKARVVVSVLALALLSAVAVGEELDSHNKLGKFYTLDCVPAPTFGEPIDYEGMLEELLGDGYPPDYPVYVVVQGKGHYRVNGLAFEPNDLHDGFIAFSKEYLDLVNGIRGGDLGSIDAILLLVAVYFHENLHMQHYSEWSLYCQNLSGQDEIDCHKNYNCHLMVDGRPCFEAWASSRTSEILCAFACAESDPNLKELVKRLANNESVAAAKGWKTCELTFKTPGGDLHGVDDPENGKCPGPPIFIDPMTGMPIDLDLWSPTGFCCCDDTTGMPTECPEGDCDENGQMDVDEINANGGVEGVGGTLDKDKDGVLDRCTNPAPLLEN